ncbi:MAG: hypothetical protein Q4A84_09800, partial [Neisseria sp.]|uniref:hypothetical protein n=1 Tax=Neisseria sp. TaxID=192066 RepID=UPI0026DC7195
HGGIEVNRKARDIMRFSPAEIMLKEIRKHSPLSMEDNQTAPTLGLADMPSKARQLCEECKTHLVGFYNKHGIAYNEADADKTAAAIGVAAYRERVPHVQSLHIREDGLLSVGHLTPQGVLSYASLDSAQAAATPIEESVAQSRQAEQELAQKAQQREMAMAEYHSQSRGRSIS